MLEVFIRFTIVYVLLRSYGCGIRCVRLQGCFVPFDADILPEDDMKTLISRPYFHIYWTNCVILFILFCMKMCDICEFAIHATVFKSHVMSISFFA